MVRASRFPGGHILYLLLAVLPLMLITSCAPAKGAREQPMSQTFSEDGSGLFKVRGQPVGWGKDAHDIPFSFDPQFPLELREGCANAVRTLNEATGRSLIILDPRDVPFNEHPDGRNVISFGKSPRLFTDNHAAETVIRISRANPRILEADIDFDTRQFKFGLNGLGREADVESTCLHELGHALGLTHVMNRQSMMNPRLTIGVPRRSPSEADRDRLLTLYPPPARPEVP